MTFIKDLVSTVLDIIIVIGPTFGYIAQYRLIKETKSVGSFSIDVCAILILANICRILFWFGQPFDNAFLLQSVVMIISQILLLRECILLSTRYITEKPSKKKFNVTNMEHFWRWDDFKSYVEFIVTFWVVICLMTILFTQNQLFVQSLGFVSTSIEACLGLPQFLKNKRSKSTEGLSYALIGSWFIGDLFKTIIFIAKAQPIQFVLCGITQLVLDILIIAQIKIYGNGPNSMDKLV